MKMRKSERPRLQARPKVRVSRRQVRLAHCDEIKFDEQGHLHVVRSGMLEVGKEGFPIYDPPRCEQPG